MKYRLVSAETFGTFATAIKTELMTKTVLNLSETNPCFLRVCGTSLLKTQWKKEELLAISPFPTVFSTILEDFSLISSNLNKCRLQTLSVWKSLKCVVWKRFNPLPDDKF